MEKITRRPKHSKAVLVTSVVLAVAGGLMFAQRIRKDRLMAKERNATSENLVAWGGIGFSDL